MPTLTPNQKNYINSPKFVFDLVDNLYAGIHNICSDRQKLEKVGQKAMEYIGDYPLYVSGLSNITYEEAIMTALVSGKDFQELLDEAGLVVGKDYTPYP